MAKASGTIDLKAMKEGHDDASKTATNYITYVDSTNGIRIYDGQSSNQNQNFAQVNSEGLAVYKTGSDVAKFGSTARVGKVDGARTEIGNGATTMYTEDGVPAFTVESGSGTKTQTVYKDIDETFTANKNTDYYKYYTTILNQVPQGEFKIFVGWATSAGIRQVSATFTKGSYYSGGQNLTLRQYDNPSVTITVNVAYTDNGEFKIKYTTGSASSVNISIRAISFEKDVNSAIVDAPYGYRSNGAQIGSFMHISGASGVTITLSTSDKHPALNREILSAGNAFTLDSEENNGIICNYAGIVMAQGVFRINNNFTAQDIIIYGVDVNSTVTNNVAQSRFRVPPNMTAPNQNITTPVAFLNVAQGDLLKLFIRNATGSRGVLENEYTYLTAQYIAPLL